MVESSISQNLIMQLSIVIPCFNEEKNLSELFDRCAELAERIDCEIISVNNGSTDNSMQVMNSLTKDNKAFKLVHLKKNKGYGNGILAGLNAASGEFLGWTHADLQTNPLDCINALNLIQSKPNSFVKGKRYGRGFADSLFTAGMSIFETLLLMRPMKDINAQPTVFSKKFYNQWKNPPLDFSIDLYAYHEAIKLNQSIIRFPVYFGPRMQGNSSWNFGFISRMRFIKRTILYSLKLRFKK